MATAFQGFPRDSIKFLKALAQNNTAAWFKAHRGDYEAALLEPAKDFVGAMALHLTKYRAAAVRKVEKRGYEVGGTHYKKVPRGFTADHPHADLLRHNGLTAGRNIGLAKDLFGKGAAAYCAGVFKDVSPMHHWLTGVVS
jgi:hypothetical protein